MSNSSNEQIESNGIGQISDSYKKVLSALTKRLAPDPLTGEVENDEILEYMKANKDDPLVKLFEAESEKHREKEIGIRLKALATFDPDSLTVHPEAIWLIKLEYVGMSDDENIYEEDWANDKRSLKRDGPPVQLFQMFCYIKDGRDDGEARYVKDYEGPPTLKQIEDFVKISMACPMAVYKPFIPGTLGFSYNLATHKNGLRRFLNTLPWTCNVVFETAEMREYIHETDDIKITRAFRELIDVATEVKNAGNEAYGRKDREEALKQYKEGIRQLEKLLRLKITEEESRDKEASALLAVCWANSSAARLLNGKDGSVSLEDAEAAKDDAEKAIAADASYAKGYVRLARAEQALNNTHGALDALARGLKHKSLQDHFGLADNLISLQTAGRGFPHDKSEFENFLRNIFEEDSASAERMKGVSGAYKRRCQEHTQKLGGI